MRKLLASIEKKAIKGRPELVAFIKDVQAKEAALEALKAQKDIAKAELKLANKALKKQLKNKASKSKKVEAATILAATAKKSPAPRTGETLAKKKASKAVVA